MLLIIACAIGPLRVFLVLSILPPVILAFVVLFALPQAIRHLMLFNKLLDVPLRKPLGSQARLREVREDEQRGEWVLSPAALLIFSHRERRSRDSKLEIIGGSRSHKLRLTVLLRLSMFDGMILLNPCC